MAQNVLTVTAPNPTPPTNFGVGIANLGQVFPPNSVATTVPPSLSFANSVYGTITAGGDPFHPGVSPNTAAPYLDDGVTIDATHTSINEKSPTPVSGLVYAAPNSGTAAEDAGTELSVEIPSTGAGAARGVTMFMVSSGIAYTGVVNASGASISPNSKHASSLSPVTNPTITALSPVSPASGTGTLALTVNGLNFTPQSVVYVNGVAQTTVYVSSSSLTVAAAPRKATAGSVPVTVVTGGVVTTAATNWTFT